MAEYIALCTAEKRKEATVKAWNARQKPLKDKVESMQASVVKYMLDKDLTCVEIEDGRYLRLQTDKTKLPPYNEATVETAMVSGDARGALARKAAAVIKASDTKVLNFRRANGYTAQTASKRTTSKTSKRTSAATGAGAGAGAGAASAN